MFFKLARCTSPTARKRDSRASARPLSASLHCSPSASQKPYRRIVSDAFASRRSSKRRRLRNAGVFCTAWNTSQSGRSSSNTMCVGCLTRVTATKPTPAVPAVFEPSCTRARLSVIPCAFQCVIAHARTRGNCSRRTFSSVVFATVSRKIGTHRAFSGSPGKKVRGSPRSSTPSRNSSNSTTTHSGTDKSFRFAPGSPPAAQTKPRTTPIAPFTKPASTHLFWVKSTRAPSHSSMLEASPRNSSALNAVGSATSSPQS